MGSRLRACPGSGRSGGFRLHLVFDEILEVHVRGDDVIHQEEHKVLALAVGGHHVFLGHFRKLKHVIHFGV